MPRRQKGTHDDGAIDGRYLPELDYRWSRLTGLYIALRRRLDAKQGVWWNPCGSQFASGAVHNRIAGRGLRARPSRIFLPTSMPLNRYLATAAKQCRPRRWPATAASTKTTKSASARLQVIDAEAPRGQFFLLRWQCLLHGQSKDRIDLRVR